MTKSDGHITPLDTLKVNAYYIIGREKLFGKPKQTMNTILCVIYIHSVWRNKGSVPIQGTEHHQDEVNEPPLEELENDDSSNGANQEIDSEE